MSELMLDVGQANELKLAFRRHDWTNDDIKKLCEGDALAKVRHLVRGTGKLEVVRHLIDCDATPFIPNRWRIEEKDQLPNRVRGMFAWDPAKVEFCLSPDQMGSKSIGGEKLKKELGDKLVLPANVLDYLLAHPKLIPESWKKDDAGNTRYIFFWGTQYRYSDGRRCVRCLCWDRDDGQWCWYYCWLGGFWHVDDPAARLA